MESPDPDEPGKVVEGEPRPPSTEPLRLRWAQIKARLIGKDPAEKNGCLEPFVKLFQIIGPLATASALIFVMIQSRYSGRQLALQTESANRTWSAELLGRIYQKDLPVQVREEAVRGYLSLQRQRKMPVRLRDADFSRMALAGVKFGTEKLRANLQGAKLNGADLRRVWLAGADLSNAQLYRTNLRGADLRGAHLMGASAQEAKFDDANLCGAKLDGAALPGARFDRADLRNVSFLEAKMVRAVLEGADLRGVVFGEFDSATGLGQRGADLRWARFANTTFDARTYLGGANTRGALFDDPLKFAPSQSDCRVRSGKTLSPPDMSTR